MNNFNLRKLINLITEAEQDNNGSGRMLPPTPTKTKQVKFSDRDLAGPQRSSTDSGKTSNSKSGTFYKVSPDFWDPENVYDKESHRPQTTGWDAQAAFNELCADLAGENPYLPVIYKSTRYYDPDKNKESFDFKVQKLVSLDGVPYEMLEGIFDNLASKVESSISLERLKDNFNQALEHCQTNRTQRIVCDDDSIKQLRDCIIDLMNDILLGIEDTDDAALIQAREVIAAAQSKSTRRFPHGIDLHSDNVMLRRIKGAYWPVYNDPLA